MVFFKKKEVQVKLNLSENFVKKSERKTEAGFCKKVFNFLDQLF